MNILFTCAGRRTYLLKYFKENLSEGDKVFATDMQLSASALQAADVKLQVPAVYDPEYINITFNICKENKIDALLSLNDLELPILAENKARFEELGVKVIISDPAVIDIAFDKYKTAQWVESLDLNAPKTYVRLDECKKALEVGEIEFPLFMKPRWGSGSIGLESIADTEELDIYYNLLMKKIKKTILATASVGDEYIMIQEKLTGYEYGLDIMNDLTGKNVGVSVKQKLAMRAGETDKAITVDLPEVREMGKKIGDNLKHIGNLDVDIMQRANGDYCVLELNPRFGGGFPFSYEAGVNLPKAIIQWVKGEEVDPAILQPEYGKMFSKNDYLMEIR
ncbi:ATP-grasp domain-containing protein [Bacteroides pyogenes]|uniref:ATP-grasp domain-containing protein n=1 Tax=Bacteroides pyogenes TaxID=310300 RepID=UPI001BADFB1A|nr:ATP-grasp domain-containing protein [Bacteroides pyogenes]MBR8709118.1 Carbamoyl-phosphate synthase large chain [Bacteroides pyogenes]MBR8717977.1 Carbamoyl-phosphate synthase large chain [Bacteroides pyogenes]MBR8747408.1 Carbamoyl-phosphate synthase large chain [Bacteroides pyogenes]MBR8757763.1 Carbamoyl-phosphate synthase large chain [Bacteroides pyogenes]MBR8780977.1 Carbamoyl-phosphate synthase large chain [Bacteroides pyogenes]